VRLSREMRDASAACRALRTARRADERIRITEPKPP
jgi:hypothetical protein